MLSRVPFLGRLARRYALRHKGQTLRAILGLLVATTVLATGLGMGESIAVSLEEAALAQLGPIDIVLRAQRPMDAATLEGLPSAAGLRTVEGAASLHVVGTVISPAKGKAEAFASIRGMSARELDALGPLGGAPEPGPGEVVLSEDLAARLDAVPGDRLRFRAASPNLGESVETDIQQVVGTTAPLNPTPHRFEVREGALGLGAEISWNGPATRVSVEARGPEGISFANESASSPVRLVVEPPVRAGTWEIVVTSDVPVAYSGGAGVVYLPAGATTEAVTFEATVVGIAEDEGRAAITGRPAALLPLGDLQRALSAREQATLAYYRTTGDPYRAVAAMEAALPPGNESGVEIRAEKAERIADAEEAGAEITGFLLVMGAFTLLAAILLAFTLFSALVEERRAELGIARALGLTRGEVALSMTMEGALYALFSALVGLLLGLAILWAIMAGIRAQAPPEAPRFDVHVSPLTIALAFGLGTLLPLATIGFASLRFARLDPARAIRGIPDDPKGKRNLALGFAIALLVLGGLLSIDRIWRLVGLPLALCGLALGLVAYKRPGLAILPGVAAVAHIVWTLYTFEDFPEDAGELAPITTLARGAILALGMSVIAVASPRPYERLSAWLTRDRPRARSVFVALKYLVARRRPVGLTMSMISLVVVVVTVMGTLFVVFSASIPDSEAGFSIIGEAPFRVDDFPRAPPADVRAGIAEAHFLPRHVEFRQANVTRAGETIEMEAGSRQFLGVTPEFAQVNEYTLDTRAEQYATDRDAWLAVERGEAILFPAWALELNGLEAGDVLTIQTAALPARDYVVAGGVDSDFAFQTWMGADVVRAMGFPTSTSVYVRVAEGADPNEVAHALAAAYAEDGLTFTSIPEEIAAISANIQALVLVFEGFLALGLFVGLAATGFLAARAVHERMRDIGTLRALGFEERDVRAAFILESTATSLMGLVVGTLAGLLVAHSIWWQELRSEDVGFRPPWLLMLGFTAAVLLLAAFASRGPANRAAKMAPAIAVRYVE